MADDTEYQFDLASMLAIKRDHERLKSLLVNLDRDRWAAPGAVPGVTRLLAKANADCAAGESVAVTVWNFSGSPPTPLASARIETAWDVASSGCKSGDAVEIWRHAPSGQWLFELYPVRGWGFLSWSGSASGDVDFTSGTSGDGDGTFCSYDAATGTLTLKPNGSKWLLWASCNGTESTTPVTPPSPIGSFDPGPTYDDYGADLPAGATTAWEVAIEDWLSTTLKTKIVSDEVKINEWVTTQLGKISDYFATILPAIFGALNSTDGYTFGCDALSASESHVLVNETTHNFSFACSAETTVGGDTLVLTPTLNMGGTGGEITFWLMALRVG